MKCWHCDTELIWGGDNDCPYAEEYSFVTNLHCPKCDSYVEVYYPKKMKEFDYELDYERLDFTDEETRKLYRIGRGSKGFYWFALILTIYVLIGDSKLPLRQ
ncbi:MAG: hypothetical protein CM15mV28_1060 [Thaumasvirus sp.]|nr:MAG: hypothetical protein CM15mV28_1060 [Thaumasvirus sp.]